MVTEVPESSDEIMKEMEKEMNGIMKEAELLKFDEDKGQFVLPVEEQVTFMNDLSNDQLLFRSNTIFPVLIEDDKIGMFATIDPPEARDDDLKKLKERVFE